MKYTKEQLQGMSDFDIGSLLLHLTGADWCKIGGELRCRNEFGQLSDWSANNPNDIMPLAFKHKISINFSPHLDAWTASAWRQVGKMESQMIDSFRYDENPLRAIACCLILVLQDKGDL